MLKKNQEMLKKAKAELMVITEAMSNKDNSIHIAERQMMDPVALLATVDQMIEQLNEAKVASDDTSVTTSHRQSHSRNGTRTGTREQRLKLNDGPVRASSNKIK